MENYYTIAELSEVLKVSERTTIRQIQTFLDKFKNLYSKDLQIPFELAEIIFDRQIQTNSDNSEYKADPDYIEAFTAEEYVEFQKRINEYPVLKEYIESMKEQIEFLRFNTAQQNEVIRDLSAGIKQRNFIEAKEKGFDNE